MGEADDDDEWWVGALALALSDATVLQRGVAVGIGCGGDSDGAFVFVFVRAATLGRGTTAFFDFVGFVGVRDDDGVAPCAAFAVTADGIRTLTIPTNL